MCWIKGQSHRETILLKNAVQNYQNIKTSSAMAGAAGAGLADKNVKRMVDQLVRVHQDAGDSD